MAFIAPEQASKPKKLMKPGNHPARCYQLIEIGTVPNTFKNDGSVQHKIRFGWEFPTQKEVFSEAKGLEPFTMGKDYNFTTYETAALRLDVESWLGKNFTDDEAKRFDFESLLGQVCLINVVQETRNNGDVVNKIKSISPLPEGFACPPAINPVQQLSFSDWNQTLFDSLPKWIRESIMESREYKAMTQPSMQKAYSPSSQFASTPLDDGADLPF